MVTATADLSLPITELPSAPSADVDGGLPGRASSESAVAMRAPSASPPPLESVVSAPLPSTSVPSSPTLPPPSTPSSADPPPPLTPTSGTSPSAVRRPKRDDGLVMASCHQCKTTKVQALVLSCRAKADPLRKVRTCRKKYCSTCLLRTYGINPAVMSRAEVEAWLCPSCHDSCCCAACKRTKEKAFAERMLRITTHAALIHPNASVPFLASAQAVATPAGVVGGAQQQTDAQRVKTLTDAILTSSGSVGVASAAPLPDGEDAASAHLHYQLQQLQHLHQMQQLQQTLQVLQALSGATPNSVVQPTSASSLGGSSEALSAPVSTITSPSHSSQLRMQSYPPQQQQQQDTANNAPFSADGGREVMDHTFGHQLNRRIAALRHEQQEERLKVEPVSYGTPLSTSIVSSGASTPNSAVHHPTIPHLSAASMSRAASHPPPVTVMGQAPASGMDEESEVNYGAIANKLMSAASLATRIFQDQRMGKQQHFYQQQCMLQQAMDVHQQPSFHQQHHTLAIPLSEQSEAAASSLSAHVGYLSQQQLETFQPLPMDSALLAGAAGMQYGPGSAAPDAEHPRKLNERDALHHLRMVELQEQQRTQLQQLLQTQDRIRSHAGDATAVVHSSDQTLSSCTSNLRAYSAADPPMKRQCQSHLSYNPSDAMNQLQRKVEALQEQQRRLVQEADSDQQRRDLDPPQSHRMDHDITHADLYADLSPINFLTEPWGKYALSADQLAQGGGERGTSSSPSGLRWPLEDGEEEDEARTTQRVT